ncbi:MAG: hypothetical protein NTX36_15340 [Proteobacteria bacterium]|nr:hypothetical protein [Pseudomonadota bacterium]
MSNEILIADVYKLPIFDLRFLIAKRVAAGLKGAESGEGRTETAYRRDGVSAMKTEGRGLEG